MDQFGLLLGLPDLTFTAATETGQPPAGKKVLMAVELSGVTYGWLIRDISREAGLDAMKENLVSVVAHELKTPVTALRLLASNIAHGVDGDR